MTANAGKDANRKSGARPSGAGGKNQRKKPSAANKPTGDEVTVDKTDTAPDGTEPADKAEQTAVDFTGTKESGAEDTVQDIKLPGTLGKFSSSTDESGEKAAKADQGDNAPADPTGDAEGSKDRLVSRGTGADAQDDPESGDSSAPSGRTTSMDTPRARGFGGAGSTGSSGSRGSSGFSGSVGSSGYTGASGAAASTPPPPSYGSARTTTLEPARRSSDGLRPEKPAGRKSPRKAHLQVARFEPWSVMKFSFIMSLVCFLVLFVAVFVLYLILSGLGVFDALTNTIRDLQGKSNGGLNPASWFSAARILGYTALIGTLNVLLITALATVWAVIYNMAADLVGGVEVTLKEADQ